MCELKGNSNHKINLLFCRPDVMQQYGHHPFHDVVLEDGNILSEK